MGRASSSKKVNRAASTGGGRTARGRTPILWYSTIFLAVLIGVWGVYISATSETIRPSDASAEVPPRVGKEHWHAAYGVFICDSWAPNLKDAGADTTGIHSHGDGLIHTHPFVRSAAGPNATFAKFGEMVDLKVTATSIELPKSSGAKRVSVKNGDKCGTKVGRVTAVVFKNQADLTGTPLKGDPSAWQIKDGQIIAIGFVPEGTKLSQPPSTANLADPVDVNPSPSRPSDGGNPPTTVAGGTPTTAQPGATTTTP